MAIDFDMADSIQVLSRRLSIATTLKRLFNMFMTHDVYHDAKKNISAKITQHCHNFNINVYTNSSTGNDIVLPLDFNRLKVHVGRILHHLIVKKRLGHI